MVVVGVVEKVVSDCVGVDVAASVVVVVVEVVVVAITGGVGCTTPLHVRYSHAQGAFGSVHARQFSSPPI